MKEFFDTLILYPKLTIGIVVILLVVIFILCETVVQVVKLVKRPRKYEYKVVSVDAPAPRIQTIEGLTKEDGGWQLCSCSTILDKEINESVTVYILKRPIK